MRRAHLLPQFARQIGRGPGTGLADRNLPAIGETGAGRQPRLLLNQAHIMAVLCELPRRGHAHNAAAQNCDAHGVFSPSLSFAKKAQ